ncbi:MAG: LutB/LldF family L-lactate oxidation iron-sulfur protein, partial [Actinomycetota bacterium]|nr:LutB/LldF family L-lactate oxidation iron-sulfur protein [Actinomycetota bacterium]
MTSRLAQPPGRFRAEAVAKLSDPNAQGMLDEATARLYRHRVDAWAALGDVAALRERAREIRTRTMDDLERHLEDFREAAEGRGAVVHRCATAAQARATVVEVCRRAGARRAAKAKSMTTEEIGLNGALETAGISVVETDLGEHILQLAGEPPAHIVAPAIEKTAVQVAELFSREGDRVSAELGDLTRTARHRLREAFFAADVGITGANFGVAETGSICLATNEGNGRLVTALPRVHVVVMGIERIVPTLAELVVLLKLLARSATGQKLTTYTTLVTGPRRAGEKDGPEEMHVVLVDNGRTDLLGGRYREMLNCFRCGACINVCPVYRKAGGAAYGPVYSGPMGAVLAPLLAGLEHAPDHPHASSLCGACTAACPVKIPLHELLLELRRDRVETRIASRRERLAFMLWSLAWSRPLGYRLSTLAARFARPLAARTR